MPYYFLNYFKPCHEPIALFFTHHAAFSRIACAGYCMRQSELASYTQMDSACDVVLQSALAA